MFTNFLFSFLKKTFLYFRWKRMGKTFSENRKIKREKCFTRLVTDDNKEGQKLPNGYGIRTHAHNIQQRRRAHFVCVCVPLYPHFNGPQWMENTSGKVKFSRAWNFLFETFQPSTILGDDDEWMWMWVGTKRTDDDVVRKNVCEKFSRSLFDHIYQSLLP